MYFTLDCGMRSRRTTYIRIVGLADWKRITMTETVSRWCAALGTCAVVAAAAIGAVGLFDNHFSDAVAKSGSSSSRVTAGSTETEGTPPSAPVTSMAVPAIKGPAPLPSEDQGVPG